jgi:hypothetical protein
VELIQVKEGSPVAERWQRLISCLENSPHLRPYVRTLAIEGPRVTLVLPAPADLGRLFPRVLSLELSGVILLPLMLALPTLKHLLCKVDEFQRQLPAQGHTHVVNEGASSPPPKLRTLEFSGRYSATYQPLLIPWIERTGVAKDLESALLTCHFRNHPTLTAFLHTRPSCFRRLELRIMGYGGQGRIQQLLCSCLFALRRPL